MIDVELDVVGRRVTDRARAALVLQQTVEVLQPDAERPAEVGVTAPALLVLATAKLALLREVAFAVLSLPFLDPSDRPLPVGEVPLVFPLEVARLAFGSKTIA
ncbi:MAG: hypothetical protein U0V73_09880 [Acidimicrobiia bacterium]